MISAPARVESSLDAFPVVQEGRRVDVVAYLTVWLVMLFGIPATQIVGPLGAIGTPALIVAAGGASWWAASWVVPWFGRGTHTNPLRVVLLGWLWYQLATIVMGHTRPLTVLEQTGAAREAFILVCLAGVALLIMDGVESIERLTALQRRVMWGGAFMAGVGVLQFFTGHRIVFAIPGLSTASMRLGLPGRSIFNRPYGTSMHPIEYSVVLAALLPIALHFALESETRSRERQLAVAATVIIGLGIPLSISRSGLVTMTAALAVLALGWTWRRRAQAVVVGLMVIPALWLTIPGLVGTIRGMFTGVENDPSITARLDRVPRIMELIRERPFFGLGAGTFSVDDYFLVDNEFWVSTMETGIVGVSLTFALVLLGAVMAVTSRHHPGATRQTTHLGYAIAAALIGLLLSVFTFDAFFYHVLRGLLFLLLGTSGALWRLTRQRAPL